MKKKYQRPYQTMMSNDVPTSVRPEVHYEQIEFPNNSDIAERFRAMHPRVARFELKYEHIDWRSKLLCTISK